MRIVLPRDPESLANPTWRCAFLRHHILSETRSASGRYDDDDLEDDLDDGELVFGGSDDEY